LWVVDQVNMSVGWANDLDIRSSCGVLDIFGFECFAINSFEQLCINYTNEALQQQFNQFIFKLEQAEYEAEHIEWAFIEFPDNQDCLDTIQAPKTGILSVLDDECRLPKGSDKNFALRLYTTYIPDKKTISENTRFQATNVQKAKSIFCVLHFAGLVEYRAETSFMEKNKDEIPLTAQTLFETAPSKLIQDSYAVQRRENEGRDAVAVGASKAQAKSKTVGQQFKEQLSSLIESVSKTDPHYIRCIKPNDAAKPLLLTRKRTTEQLRYGGVLEAVRVARAGYPVRLIHSSFFQRYRMLLPTTPDSVLPWSMEGHEPQNLCIRLVDCVLDEGKKYREATASGLLNPHEPGITRSEKIRRMQPQPIYMSFPKTDVQLGKTKVFMRKHPHDCLEAHRVFHQNASATVLQSWARGLSQQRKYLMMEDAAQTIQRCYRGFKGRERYVAESVCNADEFSCLTCFLLCGLTLDFGLQLDDASSSCCWAAAVQYFPNASQATRIRTGKERYIAPASSDPRSKRSPEQRYHQDSNTFPHSYQTQKVQEPQEIHSGVAMPNAPRNRQEVLRRAQERAKGCGQAQAKQRKTQTRNGEFACYACRSSQRERRQ
jgi:myosin V